MRTKRPCVTADMLRQSKEYTAGYLSGTRYVASDTLHRENLVQKAPKGIRSVTLAIRAYWTGYVHGSGHIIGADGSAKRQTK